MNIFIFAIGVTFNAVGVVLYAVQILNGTTHPSLISWAIWAFIAALNISYHWGKLFQSLTAVKSLIALVLTISVLLIGEETQKLTSPDLVGNAVLAIAGIVGFSTLKKDILSSNREVLIGILIFLSIIPAILGALENSSENSTPWIFWLIAYSMMTVAIKSHQQTVPRRIKFL